VLHLPYRELPVADPGTPDTRTPLRYLVWLARHQRWLLTLNAMFGIGWMVSQALVWAAVGAAIDHGVERHSDAELFKWVAVVIALGLIQAFCGAFRHQLAVTNWMNATYRTIQLIGHHVAKTGTGTDRRDPGPATSSTPFAADAMRIGGSYDSFARFSGAIVGLDRGCPLSLLSTSVQLVSSCSWACRFLGALTTPLMKPLHDTQAAQREAAGRLASLGREHRGGTENSSRRGRRRGVLKQLPPTEPKGTRRRHAHRRAPGRT